MSIATEISRIQTDRNTIRAKLVELGLATSTATLDACATAIENIANKGAISAEILEGQTYTIPAGYHNGSGVVKAMTDTAGEAEKYKTQAKTVTPTKKQQSVTPDTGNYALSSVTVEAIPDAYQDVSATTTEAGDVLTGKVFVLADGTVTTGTMANNGKVTKTLDVNTVQYVITAGYHSGTGTVSITLEEKSVTPTKSAQTITPSSGKVLSKVTVAAIPDNYQDVSSVDALPYTVLEGHVYVDAEGTVTEGTMPNNEGINVVLSTSKTSHTVEEGYHNGDGEVSISLEEKSATPTKATQTVTPTAGKVLSKVTVNPIPDEYQDVTPVTAVADTVLEGSVFVDSEGNEVEGAIPVYEAVSKKLDTTTTSVGLPNGYYDGDGDVGIILETKTATPTKSAQNITPTAGKVLSKVTVNAIPAAYQDVTAVDAVAADVLDGKIIVSSTGAVVEGSMPNNGSVTNTIDGLSLMSVDIPAGYTTGGTISLTDDIETQLAAI